MTAPTRDTRRNAVCVLARVWLPTVPHASLWLQISMGLLTTNFVGCRSRMLMRPLLFHLCNRLHRISAFHPRVERRRWKFSLTRLPHE